MKLNPLKCAFGVSAGRFLGFMVTQRGIEANPAQLKAIMQSPAPSSKKGIQQLTGRLAALRRFISRFTDRLKPFFATLRGANRAEWNEECDQAFMEIKQYLTEPPILVSPEAGDTLYLYLAASDIAVRAALFKEYGDTKLRPAPSSKKGIQQLTGRLAALRRFISRFTDRLKPFFATLRGANRAEWNEECDQAFMEIKQYLTEPPILVSPEAGDTLYLYLAASDIAVRAALFKECGDTKLRPVFFVRKSLTDAETRYSHLE